MKNITYTFAGNTYKSFEMVELKFRITITMTQNFITILKKYGFVTHVSDNYFYFLSNRERNCKTVTARFMAQNLYNFLSKELNFQDSNEVKAVIDCYRTVLEVNYCRPYKAKGIYQKFDSVTKTWKLVDNTPVKMESVQMKFGKSLYRKIA